MKTFAPYAAHVASVELFFCLAIASDLIGRERPSNHADIAYLHYLPFCMVFTSKDKLHARTVPVFLRPDQAFVNGADLKRDLAMVDSHFMAFPAEERAQGIWKLAPTPPKDGEFLVTRLWDRFLPGWRDRPARVKMDPDRERKLVGEFRQAAAAPASSARVRGDDADFMIIERRYPITRGKWRVLPPGVEDRSPRGR